MFNKIKKALAIVAGIAVTAAVLYFGLKALAWVVGAIIIAGFIVSPLSWFSSEKPNAQAVATRLVGEVIAIGLLIICGFPQFVSMAVIMTALNFIVGAIRSFSGGSKAIEGEETNAILDTADNVVQFTGKHTTAHDVSNPAHFNKPAPSES